MTKAMLKGLKQLRKKMKEPERAKARKPKKSALDKQIDMLNKKLKELEKKKSGTAKKGK